MNLHRIVAGAVGTINPYVPAVMHQATGYTTAADGTRSATYTDTTLQVQVQAVSGEALRQTDNLNLQGVLRSVYLDGNWQGVLRPSGTGGDKMTISGQVWLITLVVETWPDWSHVVVTLQANP